MITRTCALPPSSGWACSPSSATAASGTCSSLVCDGLKGLPDVGRARLAEGDRADLHRPSAAEHVQPTPRSGTGRAAAKTSSRSTPRSKPTPRWTALDEFSAKWEKRYPAIIRLWENAWAEFIPFLDFDNEIRTVICTTNAIESINARLPAGGQGPRPLPDRAGRYQVPLPGDQSLDPTGTGRQRWTNRWKAALNAFDITFDGRLSAGTK